LILDTAVGAFSFPDEPHADTHFRAICKGFVLSLICHPNCLSGGGIG
jgi:hypothetical protein